MKQKVEPTFDRFPSDPDGDAAKGETPSLRVETGLHHRRIPSWRAAGAGAAGWIALACVALLAALPDVAEEVVVSLSRPPATAQDVSVTGSINGTQKAAPSDVTRPPAFTMALGRGPSADRLWLRWTNLASRNASLLRELTPTVKPLPSEPDMFVLLAGLYDGEDSAREACKALQTRFIACDAATLDGTVVPEPR